MTMRNIGITFVTLLMLGTAIIGSGHVVLARNDKYTRDFTNNGNNQEIQQDCGNSCTQTSSNTISSGSSGLTSPPPSTSPTPTTLSLFITPGQPDVLQGTLETGTGPVVGATITFTTVTPDGRTIPLTTSPSTVVTDKIGNYNTDAQGSLETGSTVTAHYAGAPAVNAIAASSGSSVVP